MELEALGWAVLCVRRTGVTRYSPQQRRDARRTAPLLTIHLHPFSGRPLARSPRSSNLFGRVWRAWRLPQNQIKDSVLTAVKRAGLLPTSAIANKFGSSPRLLRLPGTAANGDKHVPVQWSTSLSLVPVVPLLVLGPLLDTLNPPSSIDVLL